MAVIKYNKILRKAKKEKEDWENEDVIEIEVAEQDVEAVLDADVVNFENGVLSYYDFPIMDYTLQDLTNDVKTKYPEVFELLKYLGIVNE